jgi:hypothetical protein
MWDLENIIAMNKQWQDKFDQRHPEVAQRRNLRGKSSSEPGPSSPKCSTEEEVRGVVDTRPKALEKREDIEIRVDIDTVEV